MARPRQSSPPSERRTLRWPAALVGLFFLAGLGMLGGAGYLSVGTRHDIAAGASADGMVIDLIVSRDSEVDDIYYPRVRFVTPAGEPVEFTGSVGSRPAGFDIGEAVAVLYDPADPRDARIDSFFQLWFGPLILGLLGLAFTTVGGGAVIALVRSRNRPSAPLPASPPAEPVAARPASAVERAPRD